MNYTTYVNQISDLTVIASTSTTVDFSVFIDGCITYAEQRIYREVDLLATRVTDNVNLTAGNRQFTLPTTFGNFLVVENINAYSPAGTSSATGTRIPLLETSKDFIDAVYPSNVATTGTPNFWACLDNTDIVVGPSPNAAYRMEIYGTQRPRPLSASNSSTYLTQLLPDLFVAASMVYASGYMRDFGQQADSQGQSVSWEQQYGILFQSANVEELRKKYASQAWTSKVPNQIATPPRA